MAGGAEMSAEVIGVIVATGIISGVIALAFRAVASLVSRAVVQMDAAVKKAMESEERLLAAFNDFKLEAARYYATQQALENNESKNHDSHSKIHGRIDLIAERITRVEVSQEIKNERS
jgi:hypothetical protein